MKLFYSTGSCAMSCHIALEEAGMTYSALQLNWEDTDAHTLELKRLSPLGVVPLFVSDQGKALTQNVAILEYVADLKPSSRLLPLHGTWERAEAMSWLSFVATDLHKAFIPFFSLESMTSDRSAQSEIRNWATQNLQTYLAYLNKHLEDREFLTGNIFTVADAYLFVVVGWCKWINVNIEEHKNLGLYIDKIFKRPSVQKVMKEEGLLK